MTMRHSVANLTHNLSTYLTVTDAIVMANEDDEVACGQPTITHFHTCTEQHCSRYFCLLNQALGLQRELLVFYAMYLVNSQQESLLEDYLDACYD